MGAPSRDGRLGRRRGTQGPRAGDLAHERRVRRPRARCAEEVHELAVSDEWFAELNAAFATSEVVELVLLAAFYEAVARVLQGLGVEVEARHQRRLSDFRPDGAWPAVGSTLS